MRIQTVFACASVIGALTLTFALEAQSSGPWFGTWKLNLAKSKYDPGPAPKSWIIKFEPWEGGFRNTTDMVTAQGEPRHIVYTGKFDGKDNPVKGNPDVDVNTHTRIDDHTYEVVAKQHGNVVIRSRIVISPDGKTRTQTQTGKDPQGRTLNNIIIYDKQ